MSDLTHEELSTLIEEHGRDLQHFLPEKRDKAVAEIRTMIQDACNNVERW